MKVAIIIPCRRIDKFTRECVNHCLTLNYRDYEIIILPDNINKNELESVKHVGNIVIKIIPTGPLTPGAKRNIGLNSTTSQVCAFIDSDAYPEKNWLRNAIKYLKDENVAAVGGPSITPESDNIMQKASGYILSSFMIGGPLISRKEYGVREVDELPSCNLVVKREVLEKVGGWNEKYWPGEDTLLCQAIRNLGKKIIEVPDVIVYHHRKPLFRPFLKQIARFGLHRGFFARKYRGISLKAKYFMPSLLIIYIITSSILSYTLGNVLLYVLPLIVYLTLALIASIHAKKLAPLVWLGIIAAHIVYGSAFLMGLLKRDLRR